MLIIQYEIQEKSSVEQWFQTVGRVMKQLGTRNQDLQAGRKNGGGIRIANAMFSNTIGVKNRTAGMYIQIMNHVNCHHMELNDFLQFK